MDKKGNRVKGKSLAPDEKALRADLRRQGIAPSRVRKQSTALKSGAAVKPEDIAVFSRQLATMLAAGIPLVQGLEIVGNGHDQERHRRWYFPARGARQTSTLF
jgi:type IV pilus assembly protein PilC